MASNAFVRARIDQNLKNEASAVLSELGLTVSDVVRITLTRIAKDKALPFELKTPNATTQAAMEEPRASMAAKRAAFRRGQDLLSKAGFRLTHVTPTRSAVSVVEAVLA